MNFPGQKSNLSQPMIIRKEPRVGLIIYRSHDLIPSAEWLERNSDSFVAAASYLPEYLFRAASFQVATIRLLLEG